MIAFVYYTIQVSPTKEDVVSPSIGRKVMDAISTLSFLNQFAPVMIDRRDTDSLAIETKHDSEITIHPNGSFHIEAIGGSVNTLPSMERTISIIAKKFTKSGATAAQFEIDFRSHTDIHSRTQRAGISRIFNSLRANPSLSAGPSTPTYIVTQVKPHPSAQSMFISYHPEFVDLSFRLKPLAPRMMKNRYLINAAEALVGILTKQIGDTT